VAPVRGVNGVGNATGDKSIFTRTDARLDIIWAKKRTASAISFDHRERHENEGGQRNFWRRRHPDTLRGCHLYGVLQVHL
jgi:hypothetical protein